MKEHTFCANCNRVIWVEDAVKGLCVDCRPQPEPGTSADEGEDAAE